MSKSPQEKLCIECERVFQSEKMRCPYDGSKLVRFGSGLPPGSVIDNRYTIVRLVGTGGMGSVYLARQHAMDRPVALKILHPRLGEDRSAAQRFNIEVRATARLRSPHTITVHDFGQTERGSLYLTMEYLEGVSLASVLDHSGALEPERAVRLALQICHSLAEAHDKRIVHRDLKPENIYLVERDNVGDFVKVLDFGIAKVLGPEGSAKLTKTGVVYGTPLYMSPEQATGKEVDGRSDLYALGCLLYEMLAGRPPFEGGNSVEVLYRQAHEVARPLLDVANVDGISPRLASVVDRLLSKQRHDRPGSAEETRNLLAACLSPASAAAAGARSGVPVPRPTTRVMPHAETIRQTATSAGAAPDARLTDGGRSVGREAERRALLAAFDGALVGSSGGAAWLRGPAGSGRTHLCEWLVRHARRTAGARACVATCEGDGGAPLGPVREWLECLLGTALMEREGVRQALELHSTLAGHADDDLAEGLLALLRPPVGHAPAPADAQTVSPPLTRLLLRAASQSPLILVLESCEQADPGTVTVLSQLLRTLGSSGAGLFVLLTGGDSAAPPWLTAAASGRGFAKIDLPPLADSEMQDLLDRMGCADVSLGEVILDLAGGCPGVAVACFEHVADDPVARRSLVESFRDGGALPERLPPLHLAACSQRLTEECEATGQPERAIAIVQRLGVLGPRVDMDTLMEFVAGEPDGGPPTLVDAVVDRLAAANLGRFDTDDPDCFVLSSGLIREACRCLGAGARRLRRLHGEAALLLEARAAAGEPIAPARIAAHHMAGGRPLDAVRWDLMDARERDNGDALDRVLIYQRARERLLTLPTRTRRERVVEEHEREIAGALGELRTQLGHYDMAVEAFEELRDLAALSGDLEGAARATRGLADVDEARADFGSAESRYEEAAKAFRAIGQPVEAAWCDLRRGKVMQTVGRYAEAEVAQDAARAVFEAQGETRGLASAREALGNLHTSTGHVDAAAEEFRHALALQELLDDRPGMGRTLYNLALAAFQRGELDRALEYAHRALTILDRIDHQRGTSTALGGIAMILQAQGRPAEARPFLERALRIRQAMGDRRAVANAHANLADVALLQGKHAEALELALAARDGYSEVGDRRGQALAEANVGEALRLLDDPQGAVGHHREAVEGYARLGQRDKTYCHILLGLAECELRVQRQDAARQALVTALDLAADLGLSEEEARIRERLDALA
ncbi:MAG: tetratricopeptide repeat protein [Deltaproteobacteria bacterium]|nr:tetratricopeptide repeat protein [Deltaproteobacteria bacterium]